MKIILASSSPRRIELLRQAGFSPRTISPDVDETVIRGETPAAMVKRLALAKAQRVWKELSTVERDGAVVIAADTTVAMRAGRGWKILGKPADAAEAEKMLKMIAGRDHLVFTGYALLAERRRVTRTARTVVSMRALSREERLAYVASGEPMDKAGAYAAQGIGMGLIRAIRGSYTNVVGLPMAEVLDSLRELGAKRS